MSAGAWKPGNLKSQGPNKREAELSYTFTMEPKIAITPRSASSLAEPEVTSHTCEAVVEFGREICGSLEIAERREWLVTNGIGGYASGTISGNLTRRYHGYLVAALNPPVGRTLLATKLEEIAAYDGSDYPLSSNRWASGSIEPKGYLNIESFRLE